MSKKAVNKSAENGAEKIKKGKDKKPSRFAASFKTKAFRAGGYSAAASAIVIVLAVLVNFLVSHVSTAYTSIDTTQAGLYSLSEQTKDSLSSLQKDVTIYYLASSDAQADYVTKLLDKFAARSQRLKWELVDPDIHPDFAQEYTDDAVADGDLIVVCGENAHAVHYSDMIEYEAGSYEYYYYYLQNGQQTAVYWRGEIELLKAIDKVSSDREYTVCFLNNSDYDDFSELQELLANENITSVEMLADAQTVPEDAACVIITDMTEDITDEALEALTEYLDKGGKIYAAVDDISDKENIASLLADMGLSLTQATVCDGDYNYQDASQIFAQISGEHAVIAPFSTANYILFPDAYGIITEQTQGITVTQLLKTSDSSYLSTDDSDDLSFSSYTLGAIVDNAATGAQLILYSTSAYADSDYIGDSSLANSDLFINSVAYLCDKDSAITIHAKAITNDSTLDFGNYTSLAAFAVVALPLGASILAGALIWFKRRSR